MHEQIFRNYPENQEWEGSFYERLTEYGVWDADEFWKLHLDLINTAREEGQENIIDRELAFCVASLQAKIFNLIAAHYNKNDIFKIQNLTSEKLIAFTERFEHAFLAVFSGEVIPESSYDLTNPLINVA